MSKDSLPEDWRPRVREDVVFRFVAGDWVLYDPHTQDLHVLNATAAAVWTCCDGMTTQGAMARELVRQFEGDPALAVVLGDVAAALGRFRQDGLVK